MKSIWIVQGAAEKRNWSIRFLYILGSSGCRNRCGKGNVRHTSCIVRHTSLSYNIWSSSPPPPPGLRHVESRKMNPPREPFVQRKDPLVAVSEEVQITCTAFLLGCFVPTSKVVLCHMIAWNDECSKSHQKHILILLLNSRIMYCKSCYEHSLCKSTSYLYT